MDGFMVQENMGRGWAIIGKTVSRLWKARGFIRRKRKTHRSGRKIICISYGLNLQLVENLSGEEGQKTTAVVICSNLWFFSL